MLTAVRRRRIFENITLKKEMNERNIYIYGILTITDESKKDLP